jgi:hypothetical protein
VVGDTLQKLKKDKQGWPEATFFFIILVKTLGDLEVFLGFDCLDQD